MASPGGDVRAGSLAKVVELVRAAEPEQFSVMGVVEYLEGLVRSTRSTMRSPCDPIAPRSSGS